MASSILYLENRDDGPEQGVEILPVGQRVAVSLRSELAAKEMHPQDAAGRESRGSTGDDIALLLKTNNHTAGLCFFISPGPFFIFFFQR